MAKQGKLNILIMWGDDIGQSNLSCYTRSQPVGRVGLAFAG